MGPLAIHAAKGFPRSAIGLCLTEPFKSALAAAGVRTPGDLPRGAVIAITRVAGYQRIVEGGLDAGFGTVVSVDEPELSFGDYTPGRWAWLLTKPERLIVPVPFKGALGLFNVPRELVETPA
jgi:hypothetical protein